MKLYKTWKYPTVNNARNAWINAEMGSNIQKCIDESDIDAQL